MRVSACVMSVRWAGVARRDAVNTKGCVVSERVTCAEGLHCLELTASARRPTLQEEGADWAVWSGRAESRVCG